MYINENMDTYNPVNLHIALVRLSDFLSVAAERADFLENLVKEAKEYKIKGKSADFISEVESQAKDFRSAAMVAKKIEPIVEKLANYFTLNKEEALRDLAVVDRLQKAIESAKAIKDSGGLPDEDDGGPSDRDAKEETGEDIVKGIESQLDSEDSEDEETEEEKEARLKRSLAREKKKRAKLADLSNEDLDGVDDVEDFDPDAPLPEKPPYDDGDDSDEDEE